MYLEGRSPVFGGRGRIGWVEHSRSCRVYRYDGKVLHPSGRGRYNCFDAASGEQYLVAPPKNNGCDKLDGGFVDIDEDAREEYWLRVRKRPDCIELSSFEADRARGQPARRG